MLDGKTKTTHSLLTLATEGVNLGVWGEYDAGVLRYLVSVLERPVVDVRGEMEEQPRLRASVGYYYRAAMAAAKGKEDALAEIVLRLYNSMHGVKYGSGTAVQPKTSAMGRFSEKLVAARALLEPEYMALQTVASKLRTLADMIGEIRDAFTSRGRFLEQISNNERYDGRSDKQERSLE